MLSHTNSLLTVALIVAALLFGAAGVAQADLLGYWKLDETSGLPADSTGHGFNASNVYGTVTMGQTGVIGTAFNMAGSSSNKSVITVPGTSGSYSLGGMTSLSLSSWVKLSDLPDAYQFRIWISDTGSANVYQQTYGPKQTYDSGWRNGVGNLWMTPTMTAYPNVKLNLNTWYQTTLVYDGTTGKLTQYVNSANGLYSYSVTGTPAAIGAATSVVSLGGYYHSSGPQPSGVPGLLDDAAIWNQALTATQVAALYSAPTTFTTDATAGYYGAGDMNQLFGLYAAGTGSVSINGKTWQYSNSGFDQTAGKAWISGGTYYVQLGAADGVSTAVIPEPSTLALLAAGLVGLLAYAWRKRK
jgi:hypothetical protein